MSARHIFLVMGDTNYEGSSVLTAFEAKRDADALRDACSQYQNLDRPRYPNVVEDTPENDAAFAAAYRKFKRWQNKHPGGKDAWSFDSFRVERVKLTPPARAAQSGETTK